VSPQKKIRELEAQMDEQFELFDVMVEQLDHLHKETDVLIRDMKELADIIRLDNRILERLRYAMAKLN